VSTYHIFILENAAAPLKDYQSHQANGQLSALKKIKVELEKKRKRPQHPELCSLYGGVILMAPVGHCISQAKHCMQSGSRAGSDFFSEVGCAGASTKSYSDTGQTSTHTPSPVHTSQSTATLVPCMPSFFGGSTGPQTL